MVPLDTKVGEQAKDSPRIRGDGPNRANLDGASSGFSPYSRGWSLSRPIGIYGRDILPVFAGMVPS